MARIQMSISKSHPQVEPHRWGFNPAPEYFWYERDMGDGSRILYIHPLANPEFRIMITLTPEEVKASDALAKAQKE